MKRPWTKDELATLQEMAVQRVPHIVIADALGRSLKSIRTKLDRLNHLDEYRTKDRKRKRALSGTVRYVDDCEILESRPTELMWFARDLRLSSPFRNLTGFLQGDPRFGYSALDWRARA